MYVGLVCALFGEVWVGVVNIGLLGVCLFGVGFGIICDWFQADFGFA